MSSERLIELRSEEASPSTLAEVAELAAAATAADDVGTAAVARGIEARQARFLGKHQHAVVAGAELIELWPRLRAITLPEKDPLDTRKYVVWGMKYVAGSAMDIPEIPLATTDAVLATLAEMLDHYKFERVALWQLQARRAFIAGDTEVIRELTAKIAPTATRFHHVYQCGDCPGCVFTQFASWLGPDATADDVEQVLAPVLGSQPFPPDPDPWGSILDLLYGDGGACPHSVQAAPIFLSRTYTRAGRLAEALRQAKRATDLTEGGDAGLPERALVARTAVAIAMRKKTESRKLATELVERTRQLEDAYERLDALVVAHGALGAAALATDALAIAERLDARVVKKRHVAETRRALAAG